MKGKGSSTNESRVLIGTRVTPQQREAFQELAKREHRSAAAELLRMIEQRLEEAALT